MRELKSTIFDGQAPKSVLFQECFVYIYTLNRNVTVPSQFLKTSFPLSIVSVFKIGMVVVYIDMFVMEEFPLIHILNFAIVRIVNAKSNICPLELGCIGHFVLAGCNQSDI